METLAALWLPILLSAIVVFIASWIMWTVLPHHKSDWISIPDSEAMETALRGMSIQPGMYVFPRSMSGDREAMRELADKHSGYMVVRPMGVPNMGKALAGWFIVNLVIMLLVAYVGAVSLGGGADYLTVFRVVGTAAILAYCSGHLVYGVWFDHSWSAVGKHVVDGIVYGLLTAGIFGWLWPA